MEEQLITLETAKLAKEKGFDWKTHDYFNKNKYSTKYKHSIGYIDDYWGDNYNYDWNTNGEPFKPFSKDCYSVPTQSLLQKWLREIHKIDIYVKGYGFGYYPCHNNVPPANQGNVKYIDRRWNLQNEERFDDLITYEQALEKGLQEALKLIP